MRCRGTHCTVRDLKAHKRLGNSDATCCASMAVNTCIFSTWATTFPCLSFMSFLSIHAHKVYMYRNHQQKCNLINFGPSQLFFGWIFVHHILGKVLVLDIYKNHFPKFAPKLPSHKKVNFLRTPIYTAQIPVNQKWWARRQNKTRNLYITSNKNMTELNLNFV